MNNTILGIDVGSTKICAVIAERKGDELYVTGSGITKSQGLKKGVVTNIEYASDSIRRAVNSAKRVAGTNVSKAIISISGAYVKGINSSGIVNIPNNDITLKEIDRALKTAVYNANILTDYEILHVLPYDFKLDEHFIDDPIGMNGNRLEVFTHIVTAQKTNLNNLKRAVLGSGVEIDNIVLSGYASSIATLNEDEKELGVALVDMGGATCNLVVNSANSIIYNDFLSVGSFNITNDLSYVFRTPASAAEQLKVNYASLYDIEDEEEDLAIEIPVIGDENLTKSVTLEDVQNIVRARVEETLMLLERKLQLSEEQLGAGVVLTGGMAKLDGVKELAIDIFGGVPVKIGKPREINGVFKDLKEPEYSVVVGLILYGVGKHTPYEIDSNKVLSYKTNKITNINLTHTKEAKVENLKSLDDESSIPPAISPIDSEELPRSSSKKSKSESKKGGGVGKLWQWVTHLF